MRTWPYFACGAAVAVVAAAVGVAWWAASVLGYAAALAVAWWADRRRVRRP
jgi:hypothetical protein